MSDYEDLHGHVLCFGRVTPLAGRGANDTQRVQQDTRRNVAAAQLSQLSWLWHQGVLGQNLTTHKNTVLPNAVFYIISKCGLMFLRSRVCTLCLLMTTRSSPRRPWARLDPPREESSFLTVCCARFLTRQLRDNRTATVAWWCILHVGKFTSD